MKTHRIKTGYDLPIAGAAIRQVGAGRPPSSVGVHPAEFHGLKPRLLLKAGASVKAGTPLFHDKNTPSVAIVSPASGRITEIEYGARRAIEAIRIHPEGDEYEQHPSYRPNEVASIPRAQLIQHLLKGGMWPFIRRRPFGTIAHPDEQPASIFVNAMDTAPLAADQAYLLEGQWEDYRAGIAALRTLGRVHVVVDGRNESEFARLDGVQLHAFVGRHPAGNTGTHISRIDPVTRPGKVVWTIAARHVALIGSFLLVGRYPRHRRVALVGPGLQTPGYVDTVAGAQLGGLILGRGAPGDLRLLSGNVLTGRSLGAAGYLGFYDAEVTALPEDRARHFLGWLAPGASRPTFSRAYLSGFFPGRRFAMGTSLRGERRALVKTGDYSRVVALDVLPEFLVRAVLSQDIDLMEQLGIFECAPEDFALCSYICPSKTEFTQIIQEGLDLMQKEVS